MSLKQQHERGVCERLLAALGQNLVFRGMGIPPEPDVLYQLEEGRVLGIEVVTAYYSNSSAKGAWQVARGQSNVWSELLGSPDQAICDSIRNEIDAKCVALEAPLTDQASVQRCVDSLSLPEAFSFARVYLLWQAPADEGGDERVKQLYPQPALPDVQL